MKRTLSVLAVLGLLATALWIWALRRGPGQLELPELAPWPKALAALPEAPEGTSLTGSLRHEDGTPAADALVEVSLASGLRWAWTDRQGAFTLTGLPAAPAERAGLEFIVLALEHLPVTFRTDQPPGGRVTWTLPPATPELEALPELVTGSFSGRLARQLGSPEGLEVWLVPPPGVDPLSGQIERRVTVSADGSFEFDDLTAGIYQARILPAWARGGSWPILGLGALPFNPTAQQPAPGLVTSEGRITGRVSGPEGTPLAGAMLLVTPSEAPTRLWPALQTDAAGFFQVNDLPPGRYHLELVSGAVRKELELQVAAGQEAPARFEL